jgi:PIN domain nuclease of toxin-antitoxin system
MTRALLDTHVWLWWMAEPKRLSSRAIKHMRSEGVALVLSVASLWEISIKWSLGKLPLPAPPDQLLPEQIALDGIALLEIQPRHALAVARLPLHQKDPFDRLLAVQAVAEGLPFLSGDEIFDAYGVERLW